MPLHDYPPAALHPCRLSREEAEDPYAVIQELFTYVHLPQAREQLWELLKTTVTGTWHQQKPKERSAILYFYEKLEKLIEAAHLIHEQHRISQQH